MTACRPARVLQSGNAGELWSTAIDSLGVVSAVVGLVTAVPIFWTWYVVTLGRERRYRQWFEQIRKDVSDAPVILVVDLLPDKDMLPSVERFPRANLDLKEIPNDRVFRINRDHSITPDDVPKLMDDIRRVSGDITVPGRMWSIVSTAGLVPSARWWAQSSGTSGA